MKLNLHSKKNICDDIAEQYSNYIRLGVLSDGEKLPSCRELAIELGINPNTVERAYAILETNRLIKTIPKKGSYVTFDKSITSNVAKEAEKQIIIFKDAGLEYGEIMKIIKDVYMDIMPEK